MKRTTNFPAPAFQTGQRVRYSDDAQFCQEFHGATGSVLSSRWKEGRGWLFTLALDTPVTTPSGNVHRKLCDVLADELSRIDA